MNTIEHNNLFSSKEEYATFATRWKALARAKKLTSQDCLLRCLLLKQDVTRSLPVTKNELRLANGGAKNSGLALALNTLRASNPVKDQERRAQRIAQFSSSGRALPEHLTSLFWYGKWLGSPVLPGCLSLERFMQVVALSNEFGT